MTRIAITREDGGVSIMTLSDKFAEADDAWAAAEISRTDLPSPAVSWRRMREDEKLPEREGRDQYRDANGRLERDLLRPLLLKVHERDTHTAEPRKPKDPDLSPKSL